LAYLEEDIEVVPEDAGITEVEFALAVVAFSPATY
jgi:hypothetical protein